MKIDAGQMQKAFTPGLFTFSIVCYRNWEYLTQTIDSVLMQDYSPIQLIVSDDGSGNFPIEEFEKYIEEHKRDNVVSYIVRESEKNEGTVRHLNHVLEHAEGEYFMIMAADDVLDNANVFSRYVQAFQREGQACGVVMGQTAMYDVTMSKVLEYFVWPDVIDAINDPKEPDELLQQLYYMPCIPTTSTCFRKWVMDTYGPFDTDYFLIEDYPFHIKLAEAKVKMRFENFVSARHRDGGISHGAVSALSLTKQRYFMDCVRSRRKVLDSIKTHEAPRNTISLNKYQVYNTERMVITTGTGRIGQLRYLKHYPWEFLVERSQNVTIDAVAKWISLVFALALVLLFVPEIYADFALESGSLVAVVITILLSALTVITGALALLKLVMLWINKLSKFPDELL